MDLISNAMSVKVYGFICFVFFFCSNSLAYNIKVYPGQPPNKQKAILNLVFSPLNYQSKEIFLKDIDVLIRRLEKTKPFVEFRQSLGIYYIVLSKKEENLFFKNTPDIPPLKARNDFLDNISHKLKSDYKLIIIDAQGSSFCAELSLIDKTSLLILGKKRYKNENSFAKGFLHELGHCLGLRDECAKCNKLCPAGPPNCAISKEEAQAWWGDLVTPGGRVTYITGCCGNYDYFRPTIASLMNDPDKAEDFGPVNERYLKRILEKQRPVLHN